MIGFTDTVTADTVSRGDTLIVDGRFRRVVRVSFDGDETITFFFRGGYIRRVWDSLVDIACTV